MKNIDFSTIQQYVCFVSKKPDLNIFLNKMEHYKRESFCGCCFSSNSIVRNVTLEQVKGGKYSQNTSLVWSTQVFNITAP